MKHFWGRCKDADPSKMCFPPRRRANFHKVAAQRTNSVTNAFWVCAGAGTGTAFGAKRGLSGGSWGVLGGFLGPFSGVLPRIGAPRGDLGGVYALRAPFWDVFGILGNPFGTFRAPPKALQTAVADTDTDTIRHNQRMLFCTLPCLLEAWAKHFFVSIQ